MAAGSVVVVTLRLAQGDGPCVAHFARGDDVTSGLLHFLNQAGNQFRGWQNTTAVS